MLRRGARHAITGLVVNERINVSRVVRRKFRQDVYYLRKFGVDGHLNRVREFRRNYLEHIIGVGEFIAWVDIKNASVRKDLEFLRSLRKAYTENA